MDDAIFNFILPTIKVASKIPPCSNNWTDLFKKLQIPKKYKIENGGVSRDQLFTSLDSHGKQSLESKNRSNVKPLSVIYVTSLMANFVTIITYVSSQTATLPIRKKNV